MIATTGYSAAGPARRLAFFEVCANSARDVVDQVSNAAVKTPIHPKFFILQPPVKSTIGHNLQIQSLSRQYRAEKMPSQFAFRSLFASGCARSLGLYRPDWYLPFDEYLLVRFDTSVVGLRTQISCISLIWITRARHWVLENFHRSLPICVFTSRLPD